LIGRPPANVFDTQIAAGFAGLPYPVALAKLVSALLGASLGKGLTFTHWDQRPLSDVHQRYAADDVRYLLALRSELEPRLESRGHLAYAQAECAVLTERATFEPDPRQLYLKVRGANDLKPRHLAVLRDLVVWRDTAAREHDLPPRTFLKDEMLVRLARIAPSKPRDLAEFRGLPRAVIEGEGGRVLEAIAAGKAVPAEDRPQPMRIDEKPADRLRIDALWSLMTTICIARGVDPTLVASRQELAAFYLAHRAGKPVDNLRLAEGWRMDIIGRTLMELIAGDTALRVTWKRDGPRVESTPHSADGPASNADHV